MPAYLDHAAATPMRPEAVAAWVSVRQEVMANPSSIHGAGQSARRVLEDARDRLAAVVGADAIEVVFTSGGTESINLALKGMWWARKSGTTSIVLPDGEHHATLDTVQWLHTHEGAALAPVALDRVGRIAPDRFAAAMSGEVALATAIAANNEVGTLNPIGELAGVAQQARVPLHVDAVAAFGHTTLKFSDVRGDGDSGLVAMSISAHKVGGPVGIGALVASRTAKIAPLQHGGASQRDLRGGTQDVASAMAFAVAAEIAVRDLEIENARQSRLRDALAAELAQVLPEASVLGSREERLAGNLHLLFPGAPGESMLYLLDRDGYAVSTGSACQAGIAEPSHVVQAMGYSEREARSVLRISLGHTTTSEDLNGFSDAIVRAYRLASSSRS